jgi:hypothetical protein
MCAFLYTETGVLPLAHRCLILALRYLQYILSLPGSHLTHCAFRECELLHAAGKPSWLGDLAVILRCFPCSSPVWNPLLITEDSITKLITHVKLSMSLHIDAVIASSSKGHLLQGHFERDDDGTLCHKTLHFRHYLHVPVASHRKALAQMLLADNSLAEVWLRHAERHHPLVPRIWRLCRFCTNEVEDPPHAMFGCNGSPELIDLRSAFLATVFDLSPSLHLAAFSATPQSFFTLVLSHRPICDNLAKFAYDTLQVFEQKEMYIVDSALYSNAVVPITAPSLIPSNSML